MSSVVSQGDHVSETSQDSPLPLRKSVSAHGIERQLHPSHRRSGIVSKVPPLSLEDKANRDQAGVMLISRLCTQNCWPKANAGRKKDIEECLLEANALASYENRPTSLPNRSMHSRVSHSHFFHHST